MKNLKLAAAALVAHAESFSEERFATRIRAVVAGHDTVTPDPGKA